jgi:phage baseplate assembly protein W
MASIVYDNLKAKTGTKATYVDVKFDLELDKSIKSNFSTAQNELLDIKVNEDVYAIIGSVLNIINTRKGQRYLTPEFGSNILSYLFSPITTDGAYKIGETVKESIEDWGSRVTVNGITVVPKPDSAEYSITISLYAPSLKQSIRIVGGLSQNTGFFDIRG